MNLGTRKQDQILGCVLYMSASYTRDSTVHTHPTQHKRDAEVKMVVLPLNQISFPPVFPLGAWMAFWNC